MARRKLIRSQRRLMLFCFFLMLQSLAAFAQNPIVTENALPGNPESEWTVPDFRDIRITGFATKMSLNAGSTVRFKISVQNSAAYTIKIYRIGYYGGNGARLMQNLGTFAGVIQPPGISDPVTGLIDCGNWSESASWAIPSNAVSGLYIARLQRTGGGSNHIVFIVRNDNRNSDLYMQFPDATWQAYNGYGGNSMYDGTTSWPSGHAVKASYNRPFFPYNSLFNTDGRQADWYMNATYPLIRWLERNGYDITYTSCNDVSTNGARLINHKVFISVGHDEYISKQQRANIEAARNAGVHMAFFSGNEVYWKTRWENNDGTEDRTLVCYKEGFMADGSLGERTCGSKCDPSPEWTGLWRTGGNYDAGKPENKLTGQISWTEYPTNILVPAFYKKIRLWRNTNVASLAAGQTAALGVNTLGYEWDYEQPEFAASYPEGRFTASSTLANNLTHKLSLYRHSSGALVFGAGTVQWSWGLDGNHWGGSPVISTTMQQATANLFADMGAQPGSLQSDLIAPIQSTDFTPPSASFTTPSGGSSFSSGNPVQFTGGAIDAGGGVVASVEISTDGGARWIPVTLNSIDGTITWSYTWTPGTSGVYTVYARGVDDSGNIGNPASISLTIGGGGDVTPPIVTSVTPFNRETNVSNTTGITANFTEAINSATVTGSTFQLRDFANNLVNATVSTSGSRITLTPSAVLAVSSTYTVAILGGSSGVKDLAGNALVNNYTWTFTTAGGNGSGGTNSTSLFQPTDVPEAPLVNDGQPVEYGMRFRTSQDGFVTGVRFYKGAGGTGSHVGSLWTNDGTLLARATFLNETSSGWQQVLFSNPVMITPGVTYVVSCFSASGDYAANKPFFTQNLVNGPITGLQDGLDGPNGLYMYTPAPAFPTDSYLSSNYWIDVVFNAGSDGEAPVVTSVLPANETMNVSINSVITANFSEAMNGASVNANTFQLRDDANNLVNATVNTATSQISLTPTSPLGYGKQYTVTITGGASGVKDPAGNALANDYSWNFTTISADLTPPTVNMVSPAIGASGVNVFSSISVIFSEAIQGSAASGNRFQVRDASNRVINGSITVTGNSLTFNPGTAFVAGASYTVRILGGASGIEDLSGNKMENDYDWSFNTAAGVGTYSLFTPTDLPQHLLVNDGQGIEVGMRFRSSQNGFITGARYYKGLGATGVHVGSLWTNTGVLMAQAAFVNESPSGWQQVTFSSPVSITAGVTYVISCFSPSGDYAASKPYFTEDLVNPPITGLRDGFDGPNGLYMYTTLSVFPTSSFQSSNYWVDVVYSATNGTDPVAPTVTTQPVSQTLCAGATAAFTSAAMGTPGPSVQWQIAVTGGSWTNIPGATGPTCSYLATVADNGKRFRAVWTNERGSVNSDPATINVNAMPAAPTVTVVNNCSTSTLTCSGYTGSILWSNGATTPSITVNNAGTYSVTQTMNGCTSPAGSAVAAPTGSLPAPLISVTNNCGSSTLTCSGYTGSILWSNGATTSSITVNSSGTYTVTQKVNGCTSPAASSTVQVNSALTVTTSSTPVTSGSNGTVTASPAGGTTPYTYLWSPGGQKTATATGLSTGTYNVLVTDARGCTAGGSATVVSNPCTPISVTISASSVNDFCANLVLSASASPAGNYTYLWKLGNTVVGSSQTLTFTTASANGTYSVTASSGPNCISSAKTYVYNKENTLQSYTILALDDDVDLNENNRILKGSVGNTKSGGKVKVDKNGWVASAGAFVKASSFDIKSPSNIPIRIQGNVTVTLPTMLMNTTSTSGLSDVTVNEGVTTTISGNRKDVTIKKNARVTLTGSIFGKIKMEDGSRLTFSGATINLEELSTGKNSTVTFSKNTSVKASKKIDLDENNRINPTGWNVIFFVNDDFKVKEGSKVIASVYAPNGNLEVEGADDYDESPTEMTGRFIGKKITSRDKGVVWNLYDCENPPVIVASRSFTPAEPKVEVIEQVADLSMMVSPNPGTSFFNLAIRSNDNNTPVTIRILDANGRVLSLHKTKANSTLRIVSEKWLRGMYFAEALQGGKRTIVKLIKLN